eukprot:scaffold20553_cov23-Cyclotella_meneghiniana.AAC.1
MTSYDCHICLIVKYVTHCVTSNQAPVTKEALAAISDYIMKNRDEFSHLDPDAFHPNDPPSCKIQQLWRDYVSEPAGDSSLSSEMKNKMGEEVDIRKLIVAYSSSRP